MKLHTNFARANGSKNTAQYLLARGFGLWALVAAPVYAALEDDVVGRWKLVSHLVTFDGQTFDSHQALLQQRPCAADIVYETNRDKTYRLNAAASSCDEKYKKMQEKLYAKTQWKLDGATLTTSATHFAVGQSYTVSVAGKQMVWVGKDGQGTLTYQRQ
ncbi:MAG TPA: hypothetical protein PK011_16340 [Marinagarivorans sp.]|nr:hypothetical protein [Cellvibrionaceae bacterium]HMY40896.1 hypothetical protein [Marinagarivorans sp.]HNG59332.1 hypothetical protein [Cellvibrionaceae bacterium]